ncbi:hypothetical protein [Lysinibacillus sp. 54212]|uniref:hypothetical protein n=1 Tax=Lysinibacillus sp. 54212 TaxID=3119829 RepID=UPI002FCBC697
MNVHFGSSNYLRTLKTEGSIQLSDDLFSDKAKQQKTAYEIKKENGYIRHYITKANGEKVMIKESKLPKSQENERSSGHVKDMITEILMHKLANVLDKKQFNTTGISAQKEEQIKKYITNI